LLDLQVVELFKLADSMVERTKHAVMINLVAVNVKPRHSLILVTVKEVGQGSVDTLNPRTGRIAEHRERYAFDLKPLADREQVRFNFAPSLTESAMRERIDHKKRPALLGY
jgi:hypothetical protein